MDDLDFFPYTHILNLGELGILKFEEATVWECFDFQVSFKNDETYLEKFVIEFLEKNLITHDDKPIEFEKFNYMKLWDEIKNRYFKGFFTDEVGNGDKSKSQPFSFIVFTLSKYLGDPYEIMKKWTFSQYNYWFEGLIWDLREQTEEGKKENDEWRRQHKDHEFMKKNIEKLDDIFNNYDELIKTGKMKVQSTQKVTSK